MGTYHPSCSVRLQFRLDEGANVKALNATLKKSGTATSPKDSVFSTEAGKLRALTQIEAEIQALSMQRKLMAPVAFEERRARLKAQRSALQNSGNADVSTRPGAISGNDPDDLVVIGELTPSFCKILRNGLNAADEFDLDIDFRDAPFDPRAIRAVFVEISMGVVPSDQFAAGIEGASVNGTLMSQIERNEDTDSTVRTKFFGFADEHGVSFGEGDTISFSGRSIDSLLMTVDMADEDSIDLKRPLVEGVRNLLDKYVETQGMEVVFGNPQQPIGTSLGPIPDAAMPATSKARKGTLNNRARSTDRQRMKLWDHITEVVQSVGYIPLVRGIRLYLADPRTFTLGEDKAKKVVWGRNLEELSLTRNLGGTVKARTIEVRSYDSDVGKTRWARYPVRDGAKKSGIYPEEKPEPTRANEVTPSGVATDEVMIVPVKGITENATLERIAASVFQQFGRQEIEGSFRTMDVTSVDGEEGDLLNLYPADAVEVLIASDDSVPNGEKGTAKSNLQELQAQSIARRNDYLRGLGYSTELSKKMATAQQTVADQQTTFRVAEVSVIWNIEDGFEIEVGINNFLVVREDSLDTPKLGPGAAAAAVAGARGGLAADALRSASSAQQTLGSNAQSGTISPETFAADGAKSDQETRVAARGARGT